MRVIFLGTNGWYDSETGYTVSIAIDAPSFIVILDAGNGITRLDRHITLDRPAYLLLSHFHLDHIIGLHAINAFEFPKGLSICGEEGIAGTLGRILDAPFTTPFRNLRFKAGFVNLPREAASLPFEVTSLPLMHAVHTLGYRMRIEGKTIAYVGDTGYCANAVDLARDADLLIAECAYRSGQEDPGWPHLNPESAARIAAEGRAKRLVLVHFDARLYPGMEDRKAAEAAARRLFPDTIVSEDGMVLDV